MSLAAASVPVMFAVLRRTAVAFLRRSSAWLALLAVACLLAACSPYTVIQRSGPPAALAGMQTVYVQYVQYVQFDDSRVQISHDRMSEQQWLEERVYAGVIAWPSRVMAHVIFLIDGQVVDDIPVLSEEESSMVMSRLSAVSS